MAKVDLQSVQDGWSPQERRQSPRHRINGVAHLVDATGRTFSVRLVNLSSGGALVSAPEFGELFVGSTVTLAGQVMPWERRAQVIAISPQGLHLRFA